MAIFKNLLGIREIKSPIFYKEFREENYQLLDLIDLMDRVKSDKKEYIERDIAFLKSGIQGEKNVYFELKNSFIPMICLHDIRIQDGDYVAQLDFIVITAQFIMILETKKLNGDIYINESGDFIRYIKNKNGRVIKKEGIYSPIAQNDRHVRIVKNMLIKNGIIKSLPVISGVVIANPKSIVNKTKAPGKIKHEIFRYDQLTEIIKNKISYYKKDHNIFEDRMKNIGEFFMINNKSIRFDYNKKYSLTEEDFMEQGIEEKIEETIEEAIVKSITEEVVEVKIDKKEKSYEELVDELKKYRLNKSREENIKPYFIYNNEMMEELITVRPKDKKELIAIRGFGPAKIEKYGQDIIQIIRE
ncbi:HRDC domain-containing protein [Clostridioides difficile]